MTFEDTGKGSRAWWLRLIKQYAGKGGTMYLTKVSTFSYPVAKQAIDNLVGTGYIALAGKPGDNRTSLYELTPLGHRYLNEVPDELPDSETDTEDPRFPHSPEPIQKAAESLKQYILPQNRPPIITPPPRTMPEPASARSEDEKPVTLDGPAQNYTISIENEETTVFSLSIKLQGGSMDRLQAELAVLITEALL